MTPDQWRRIQELLPELEQLPESEHEKFLERHCADDSTLRDSLRDMVRVKSITREKFLVPPTLGDGEADECTLEPGTTLGEFTILELLGRGGMGTVYLAHDERLNRDVALKLMSTRARLEHAVESRLEQEARAAAGLNHANIVRVFSTGVIGTLSYIAMEFIDGESLASAIRASHRQPTNPRAERWRAILPHCRSRSYVRAIAQILRDVAGALQHAHDRGLIHCDVSPGNILVEKNGNVFIVDFGVARIAADRHTESSRFVGTLPYASPERLTTPSQPPTRASDVYSLGCVLYEALTGARAFERTSINRTVDAILRHDSVSAHARNPRVHPDLDLICRKAMAKDPKSRFQSAAELADELDRFLSHEPISTREPGWIAGLNSWARDASKSVRRPLCLALAFAAGVIIATPRGPPEESTATISRVQMSNTRLAAIDEVGGRVMRAFDSVPLDDRRTRSVLDHDQRPYKISFSGGRRRLHIVIDLRAMNLHTTSPTTRVLYNLESGLWSVNIPGKNIVSGEDARFFPATMSTLTIDLDLDCR